MVRVVLKLELVVVEVAVMLYLVVELVIGQELGLGQGQGLLSLVVVIQGMVTVEALGMALRQSVCVVLRL